MNLQKISHLELKSNLGIQAEMTRDFMLDKIFLLMVSHFCLATEIRFLASEESSQLKGKEGKIWHRKGLDFAKHFVPHECPLYAHMKSSYDRNYKLEMSGTKKKFKSGRRMDTSFRSNRAKTPHLGNEQNVPKQYRPRSSSGKRNTKQSDNKPRPQSVLTTKKAPEVKQLFPLEDEFQIDTSVTLTEPTPKSDKPLKIEEFQGYKPKDISYPVPYSELDAKLKQIQYQETVSDSGSEEMDPEEIVISSYDLYGIYTDDEDSDHSEFSDSTGGRNNQALQILKEFPKSTSGTGGGH